MDALGRTVGDDGLRLAVAVDGSEGFVQAQLDLNKVPELRLL